MNVVFVFCDYVRLSVGICLHHLICANVIVSIFPKNALEAAQVVSGITQTLYPPRVREYYTL